MRYALPYTYCLKRGVRSIAWYNLSKAPIDTVNIHFVSCQVKLDLNVLMLFTFCCGNETHRSILNWTTPKCKFTASKGCPLVWSVLLRSKNIREDHDSNTGPLGPKHERYHLWHHLRSPYVAFICPFQIKSQRRAAMAPGSGDRRRSTIRTRIEDIESSSAGKKAPIIIVSTYAWLYFSNLRTWIIKRPSN